MAQALLAPARYAAHAQVYQYLALNMRPAAACGLRWAFAVIAFAVNCGVGYGFHD